MDNATAKEHAASAERGGLTDLGALLRGLISGEVQIHDGDFVTLKINGTTITATAAELNKLADSGDVVASGTPVSFMADVSGSTGTTDPEARAAINEIRNALIAFGIMEVDA